MINYINLFGIKIPVYGLCLCFAMAICTLLAVIRAKKKDVFAVEVVVIMSFTAGISLLSGKLLFIFVTYPFGYIVDCISNFDFEFAKNSGIIFYGGLIGGIFGALYSSRIMNTSITKLEHIVVPLIPFGHAIGRIGCLLSGCCYGMEYSGPFAVKYQLADKTISCFPVQPLEALLDILIMIFLFNYTKKEREKFDTLSMYLVLYGIVRFVTEMFRGDSIRGFAFSLSTSQWISIVLILSVVVFKI